MYRDFQKIKTLDDFNILESPREVEISQPRECPFDDQNQLRVLVRPKYGNFSIPDSLKWIGSSIQEVAEFDYSLTGIKHSWCYVTIRHGFSDEYGDSEWHFDGASFRTDTIPERNYIWFNNTPTQYREGRISFPENFDPSRHNLHKYADFKLDKTVYTCKSKQWYLLLPFCLHRKDPKKPYASRTFIRISFLDVEIRDINNTLNPLIETMAFGRNPVESFRNSLMDYESQSELFDGSCFDVMKASVRLWFAPQETDGSGFMFFR